MIVPPCPPPLLIWCRRGRHRVRWPARAVRPGPRTRRPADATVIAIDSGDLVVDIGSAKGVHEGDVLELWRPVSLRHPVTGQVLVDCFRIGSLRLTQVRSALSLSVVDGALARPPATGDVVILPERGLDAQPAKALPNPNANPGDGERERDLRAGQRRAGRRPEAARARRSTSTRRR